MIHFIADIGNILYSISIAEKKKKYPGAEIKNDVSRRKDDERRISARGCRTTYCDTRMKNDVRRKEDGKRRISACIFVL